MREDRGSAQLLAFAMHMTWSISNKGTANVGIRLKGRTVIGVIGTP
jgi:hypothetical protein